MQQLAVSTVQAQLVSGLGDDTDTKCTAGETRLYSSEDDVTQAGREDEADPKSYPFALVLRLRVLQIVCGISAMVMGTVALIEERGSFNLGLGVPAGGITVLAASLSIHYSRGFGGYQPGQCSCSQLRWLGPNPRTAALLAALWGTAALLVGALGVRALLTLLVTSQDIMMTSHTDVPIIAAVQLTLALMVIVSALLAIRVDCSRDPD